MLREAELANVERKNIKFGDETKIVSLYIAVSKGGQSGLLATRTLQCCCHSTCSWDNPCPFFDGILEDLPLEEDFIARKADGAPAKKAEIVAGWRDLYGSKVTGHSGRRSGWQIPQVAFLGRWTSNVIWQYAQGDFHRLTKERFFKATANNWGLWWTS